MDQAGPAARMPLLHGRRLRKRWRYVGVFSPQLMVCAAEVHVGPLPTRFFAVAEPGGPIVTATPLRRSAVVLHGSSVRVRAPDVHVDIDLDEDGGVATAHDAGRIWTRKQAGIAAHLAARVRGRSYALDCFAVVDDTVGYHPRQTRWTWCAGVGTSQAGSRVAWNLVSGVNDEPTGSERAIWVDGAAHEPGPVEFADGLAGLSFAEGGMLRFDEWCGREARLNLLLVRSAYRQPFGTFTGELPGAGILAEGYGVMEWHDARW